MAFEEHPHPEGPLGQVGGPVLAAVLALVVFAAMLTLGPGTAQSMVVVGAAVVQLAVIGVRGLIVRRRARLPDRSLLAHQFAVLASVQGGLTYLWSGEPTAVSAAVYVGVGLVFAAVMLAVLRFTAGLSDDGVGADDEDEVAGVAGGRTDTRPLPTPPVTDP